MKKRISIYIDGDLWEDVKTESWRRSHATKTLFSASQFTEDALRSFLSILPGSGSILKDELDDPVLDSDWKEGTADPPDCVSEHFKGTATFARFDELDAKVKQAVFESGPGEIVDDITPVQFKPQPKAKWKGAK